MHLALMIWSTVNWWNKLFFYYILFLFGLLSFPSIPVLMDSYYFDHLAVAPCKYTTLLNLWGVTDHIVQKDNNVVMVLV
jgi:hypothetical protein